MNLCEAGVKKNILLRVSKKLKCCKMQRSRTKLNCQGRQKPVHCSNGFQCFGLYQWGKLFNVTLSLANLQKENQSLFSYK